MKKLVAAAWLLLAPLAAHAQTVQQSGTITAGHAARWITTGVIGDAGTAANGLLTSLGVTATGPAICQSSAASGSYNRICLSVTGTTAGITLDNIGSATGGFTVTINGVTQSFGGSVQSITTTAPIVGGPITVSGAISCPTCVVQSGGTIAGNYTFSGNVAFTSSASTALTVGPNGATNPSFQVDPSSGAVATGVKITSEVAGSGAIISAISSGTDENLVVQAKGAGSVSVPGTFGVGGQLQGSITGSAAAPSYTWGGDLDTGFYRIGANNIGVSVGGAKLVDINATRLAFFDAFGNATTNILLGGRFDVNAYRTGGASEGGILTMGWFDTGPVVVPAVLGHIAYIGLNSALEPNTMAIVQGIITDSTKSSMDSVIQFGIMAGVAGMTGVVEQPNLFVTFSAGAFDVPNSITVPNGAFSSPPYTFNTDASSGMYLIASHNIGFTINSVKLLDLAAGSFGVVGTANITSTSALAFTVGANASSSLPALTVDASTASSVTGIKIKSGASATGAALSVTSNVGVENLKIDALGSGTITLAGTSSGAIILSRATTISSNLTYGGVALSNAVTGTGNMVLSNNPTLLGLTFAASGLTNGPSIITLGNLLVFAGGTSGYVWNNQNAGAGINLMSLGNTGAFAVVGPVMLGSVSPATMILGETGFTKISASGSAPGAGTAKIAWVAGTSGGTCKMIAYAGTSTTPTTVIDNVGGGC